MRLGTPLTDKNSSQIMRILQQQLGANGFYVTLMTALITDDGTLLPAHVAISSSHATLGGISVDVGTVTVSYATYHGQAIIFHDFEEEVLSGMDEGDKTFRITAYKQLTDASLSSDRIYFWEYTPVQD